MFSTKFLDINYYLSDEKTGYELFNNINMLHTRSVSLTEFLNPNLMGQCRIPTKLTIEQLENKHPVSESMRPFQMEGISLAL